METGSRHLTYVDSCVCVCVYVCVYVCVCVVVSDSVSLSVSLPLYLSPLLWIIVIHSYRLSPSLPPTLLVKHSL